MSVAAPARRKRAHPGASPEVLARMRAVRAQRGRERAAAQLEDLADLLAAGVPAGELAERFGVSVATLRARCERAGRADLRAKLTGSAA